MTEKAENPEYKSSLAVCKKNIERAEAGIEKTKPSVKYSHAEGLFHRNVGEANGHSWLVAYARDVGFLLECLKTAEKEEKDG